MESRRLWSDLTTVLEIGLNASFSVFAPSVILRCCSRRYSTRTNIKLRRRAGDSRQSSATATSGSSPNPDLELTMILHVGWQLSFRRSTSRLPFQHNNPVFKRTFASRSNPSSRKFRRAPWIASAFVLSGVGLVSYDPPQQIAHTLHAVRRCSRVAEAVVPSAIDYKRTLSRDYSSEVLRQAAMSECHTRSAKRVLRAMLANGGEFYTFYPPYPRFTNKHP